MRNYPFPQAAVVGWEAQKEFSQALNGGKSLWVTRSGHNTTGFPLLNHALLQFGTKIRLPDGRALRELDGNITAHRFRYSDVRLVALALTGASDVLFTVLGHDDKETTLGYIFRNPEFHADVNKIREEAKFVLVKEVFGNSEKNGGLAAPMVRRVKADLLARSGKKELDTEELAEAAQILGDAEMVRPGVLCTAQRLERGACSSTLGLRDVGACTTVCLHRLETAANRQTRRQNIDRLLAEIAKAGMMTRVYFQGQLMSNLSVFPDLIEEYVADPRLQPALADFDPKRWEGIQLDICKRLDQVMGVTR